MSVRKVAVPLLAMIIFLILWELLVWANGWPNYIMASPSDLPAAYSRFWELFIVMGWQTLWRTVVGLFIAVVFGVLVGMVMGFSRTMRDALYPLLVGFNAIPKATVVPIVALLFVGAHDFNTILIAFMISFFPIAVSVSPSVCQRLSRNTAISCDRSVPVRPRSSGKSRCPKPCPNSSAR